MTDPRATADETVIGNASPRPWLFRIIGHWGVEVVAVVVVVFGGITALGHFATSGWQGYFLYNGDSIVLPLIEKSLQRGEAFDWVFSSQLFLFPEGIFYAVSTLFTDDARVALATNAILNLVALYLLLRLNAHFLARHSRHRFLEVALSLLTTGIFGVYVLLESQPAVNGTAIAGLFLLTTYYYGAILVGLAATATLFWVTDTFGARYPTRRRAVLFIVLVGAMLALATLSNPLVLLQVAAPIVLALLILFFAARVPPRLFLMTSGTIAIGSVIGLILRKFFARYLEAEIGGYLALSQIPRSVKLLATTFVQLFDTAAGALKAILAIGLVLISIGILVYALFTQARPRLAAQITTAEFFIAAFVSVSSISLVAGVALTGQQTTRYLLPAFVFPLLMALAIGIHVVRRMLLAVERTELRRNLARFSTSVVALASALVLGYGVASIPATATMLRGDDYTLNKCFDDFIGDSKANGVGSFWLSRPLELYGTQKGEVLQVTPTLEPFAWMTNLASYQNKTFSFVILDRAGESASGVRLDESALKPLGAPKREISCSSYVIADYRGTAGEKKLTDLIDRSADSLLKLKE